MTARQRNACKLFAADARKALKKSEHIGLSAFNYRLSPSEAVLTELRAMLPGVIIESHGVLGYVWFSSRGGDANAVAK